MTLERHMLLIQLYPSGRYKVTFCNIKALIFNGSCSSFERFSFQIGHIFSAKFEKKIPSILLPGIGKY